MDKNFPIFCVLDGNTFAICNDKMGAISLLEDVACHKLWISILYDVLVWESSAVKYEDNTCLHIGKPDTSVQVSSAISQVLVSEICFYRVHTVLGKPGNSWTSVKEFSKT